MTMTDLELHEEELLGRVRHWRCPFCFPGHGYEGLRIGFCGVVRSGPPDIPKDGHRCAKCIEVVEMNQPIPCCGVLAGRWRGVI